MDDADTDFNDMLFFEKQAVQPSSAEKINGNEAYCDARADQTARSAVLLRKIRLFAPRLRPISATAADWRPSPNANESDIIFMPTWCAAIASVPCLAAMIAVIIKPIRMKTCSKNTLYPTLTRLMNAASVGLILFFRI